MGLVASALQEALQAAIMGGDDQGAIEDAVATMYEMTGNAGQESIVSIGEDAFREWANSFLENPEEDEEPYGYLSEALSEDMLAGTEEIWAEGTSIVQSASMFHDSEDEEGEGTGVELGIIGEIVNVLRKIF